MNPKILEALGGDEDDRYMMQDCIKDVLGYPVPSQDKPFKAYEYTKDWMRWENIPEEWRTITKKIFSEFKDQL